LYLFESLNQLIQTYLPEDQIKRLRQAYLVARDAHEGQTRSSGEPYITHPVAVACILAEMKLDYETLMAALLALITAIIVFIRYYRVFIIPENDVRFGERKFSTRLNTIKHRG